VEVLATLVLVAIIIPVAMRAVSLATALAGRTRDRIEAAALAEDRLVEVMATGAWQAGDQQGDFGEDWPRYKWALEVKDWEGTTLSQVTVRVTWQADAAERSVSITTLAAMENL